MPQDLALTWREKAACRGIDTNLFFPGSGPGKTDMSALAAAKKVCAQCPVSDDCLEEALSMGEIGQHGVWGGTSEKQRRKLRAARNRETAA